MIGYESAAPRLVVQRLRKGGRSSGSRCSPSWRALIWYAPEPAACAVCGTEPPAMTAATVAAAATRPIQSLVLIPWRPPGDRSADLHRRLPRARTRLTHV